MFKLIRQSVLSTLCLAVLLCAAYPMLVTGAADAFFPKEAAGSLILRDGAIVTTKQDTGEHGYGIKSIKSIAELYGGTADCFVEDSIFYLVVTFPCGKSQKQTA